MIKPGDKVKYPSKDKYIVVDVSGDRAILRDPDDLNGENLFAVKVDDLK